MAAASYAEFVAAVQALNVTGVSRKFTQPPSVFNRSDLPCSFVWFPSGDNVPMTFGGNMREFKKRNADLIVVYEATKPTADPTFTETVAMMDAVETALLTLNVGWSNPSWEIRSQLYQETDDRWYWAVIATINGTG